ncbi:hypothetical protein C2845_PM16G19780 [Panicum miliaceum]|uniref:Uncharacterized protein n=1 Tax=Panicum miliaceum TaxID=4540 RepID=A0A3L6PUB6_PANMI|nr:hypothetical protein C2845_PM16G19780 [Panicum miliaceum]
MLHWKFNRIAGLLVAGAVGKHECGVHCVDGSARYVTCANYPGQRFHGCNCACGPSDGRVCVVHNPDGSAVEDCPK